MKKTYISKHLTQKIKQMEKSSLTAIVAPMGYGKTTLVNWYLEQQKADKKILRVNIYSNNVSFFWRKFQQAFLSTDFYEAIQKMNFPEDENSLQFFLELLENYLQKFSKKHILFIDDFHLLSDKKVLDFLLALAKYLPEQIHLIIASRNRFLTKKTLLEMGNMLCQIDQYDLRLNERDLSAYCYQMGVVLTQDEKKQVMKFSEGWFSFIYLCLTYHTKWGILPIQSGDIYEMMDETILQGMTDAQQEFMVAMSIADEFTLSMAKFITRKENVEQILQISVEKNAFISISSDKKTYCFHHMLKECTKRRFFKMPVENTKEYLHRYGLWYEQNDAYAKAMMTYQQNGDKSSLLRVIQKDCSVELSYFTSDEVCAWIEECTKEELSKNPLALLVLMRRFFSWQKIPKMLELQKVFLKALEENTEISMEEKEHLIGECDLVMSFLQYNDIIGMSKFHRSACEKMKHFADTMGKNGSWTFGSPSVLAMFYREVGQLEEELFVMHQSMPYYYKVTNYHGYGAEYVMEAEAMYMRGDFQKAKIALEKAKIHSLQKRQEYIRMCCLMLQLRMSLVCEDRLEENWYEKERMKVSEDKDPLLLNVLDLCAAYYYALIGKEAKIPTWIYEGNLKSVHILAPAKPMAEIIYNQVLLVKKQYAKVIARENMVYKLSKAYPYQLCLLNLEIQLAGAYHALGQWEKAQECMKKAIKQAKKDEIWMPFVENSMYLQSLMPKSLKAYEEIFLKNVQLTKHPVVFEKLTKKEIEVASLIVEGKRNKEIAELLYTSEGTIKQYINRIYNKLELSGKPVEKRKKLENLLKC